MPQIGGVRFLRLLGSLLAVLALTGSSDAVQIDLAADGVQLKEGCAGDTAAACGLRMYQVMVESFVDGDPNRNYNAGYGTSHHKGDIRGIINSLDYIQRPGIERGLAHAGVRFRRRASLSKAAARI